MLHILIDRGREYCGKVENQDYELYLVINDIEHTKTKVKHPPKWYLQTLPQDDFTGYQLALRKTIYMNLATLQADLDEWVNVL